MPAHVAHNASSGRDALDAVPHCELFAPSPIRGRPDRLWGAASTWFGIGLSGRKVSTGLPVDSLVLLLGQELLRRRLGHRESVVLVADSNAIAAGHPAREVEAAARRTEATLSSVARRLRLPLRFVRGSSLVDEPSVRDATRRWENPPPYIAHQLAQMRALAKRGATLKLGWAMSGSYRDEASFDRGYRRIADPPMAFLYTICGRSLDRARPRACPYLCEDPATRILLEPGEDIEAKLASAAATRAAPAVRGYRRFLGKLGRATARLQGRPVPRDPLSSLQGLVDGLAPANDCAITPCWGW